MRCLSLVRSTLALVYLGMCLGLGMRLAYSSLRSTLQLLKVSIVLAILRAHSFPGLISRCLPLRLPDTKKDSRWVYWVPLAVRSQPCQPLGNKGAAPAWRPQPDFWVGQGGPSGAIHNDSNVTQAARVALKIQARVL